MEDAAPLAAGARRASLGACLSHRWAGRGGACAPSGAWEDPAPRNLPKNALPPGRLPGLLPSPTPCGPWPCAVHREVLRAPQWACTPHPPKAGPQEPGQRGLGLPVLRRPCFLVPLSQARTWERLPHRSQYWNPAWQGLQAVPTSRVNTQIRLPETAGVSFRLLSPNPHQKPGQEHSSTKVKGARWHPAAP